MPNAYAIMRYHPATYWEPDDESQIGSDYASLTKAEIAMESLKERHPRWYIRIAIIDDNGDEIAEE